MNGDGFGVTDFAFLHFDPYFPCFVLIIKLLTKKLSMELTHKSLSCIDFDGLSMFLQ